MPFQHPEDKAPVTWETLERTGLIKKNIFRNEDRLVLLPGVKGTLTDAAGREEETTMLAVFAFPLEEKVSFWSTRTGRWTLWKDASEKRHLDWLAETELRSFSQWAKVQRLIDVDGMAVAAALEPR